ncbi:ABC transporter transmembrane domain-containing protein [Ligilactobacillus cholophilus]|uniref:ABC transporter transmembrane domain-containing protein n=1 Tax=Ligilactobacillus cholophilus TaxID=3050131 RepID=UPI0025AF4F90|nr:ABC transporter ATP-binding protein [Ligilactobacillus cholophilus]
MKWLNILSLSKKDYILYFLGCVIEIVTGLLTVRLTYMIKILIDVSNPIRYTILLLIIGINIFILSIISQFMISYVGNNIILNTRNSIWSKILDSSSIKDDSSEVGGHIVNDIELIENFLTSTFPQTFNSLIIGICSIIMMFRISNKMSIELCIICFLIVIIIIPFSRKLNIIGEKIQERKAKLINITSQLRGNLKDIKSFNAQDYAYNKFSHMNQSLYKESMKRIKIFSLYSPLINIMMLFVTIIVVLLCILEVRNKTISIGSATIFIIYLNQVVNPIMQVMQFVAQFKLLNGSIVHIIGYCKLKNKINFGKNINHIDTIQFKNVSFSYDESNILEKLNLSLKKGDYISVIGESGVGKSTLLNLIIGFIYPTKGDILINNVPLSEFKIFQLRNRINYISDEKVIIPGTLREFLTFNSKNYSEKDLWNVLHIVNMDQIVKTYKEGLDLSIGEFGNNFSYGQIQRFILARGLLRKCDVLLLDEAFANIDEKNNNIIRKRMYEYLNLNNIIVIEVIHNISQINKKSRVLELKNKKLIERGKVHEQSFYNRG